jgi:hypothetical protein
MIEVGVVVVLAVYEVVLCPAAKLFMLSLGSQEERIALATCLREELGDDSPNAGSAYAFDPVREGHKYIALPLYFNAIVAVYRAMTHDELMKLRREQNRKVARIGYVVFDLLPAEAGFYKLTTTVSRGGS